MSVALLPNPPTLFDYYVSGGFINNAGFVFSVGSTQSGIMYTAYTPLDVVSATPRPVWTFGQGGTGVTSVMEFFRGVLCWRKSTTSVAAIDGMGGIAFIPQTDITDLDPSFRMPSWQRVNWLTMNLSMDAGTLDRNSGIILTRNDSVQGVALWPIAPALLNNGGFGIVGNGAGNWAWESYDNTSPPPATVLESVDLASFISDPADWHTFDFVIISGAGSREAVFQLLIDGVLRIERNWVTGTTLFPLTPDTYRWQPIWQVATTTDDAIRLANWEYKMGRFTPDGRELFK